MEVQTKITLTLRVPGSCWHWLLERTRSANGLVEAHSQDAQFTRGEPCTHRYIISSKFLGFEISFFSPTSHPKSCSSPVAATTTNNSSNNNNNDDE